MASVKRVEYKSGRVVYRIVICQGYDKKGNKLVKNLTYSVNQSATPKQQEREAKKYAMDMEDKLKYVNGKEKKSYRNKKGRLERKRLFRSAMIATVSAERRFQKCHRLAQSN